MSLEQAIIKNTAVVKELIAALAKSSGASDSTSGDTGTKSTTTKNSTAKKSTQTAETLKAKLVEYKELTDLNSAKALTKKLGYDSIAEVPEDKRDEVFAAIDEAIAELNGAGDEGDDL